MNALQTWMDRFCRKHPNFGIPNLMKYIVIGNVVVFLLDLFSNYACSNLLAFFPDLILQGQVWRIISFIFIPINYSPLFFLLSLYFYWFIGTTLEREWGSGKFTLFYASGIVLTVIAGVLLRLTGVWEVYSYVNMYYVNMSMFLAFASLYPDMQVLFFFIIPVKVKWLAWLDLALFGIDCVRYIAGGVWMFCLLPLVAVLNYLLFFWSDVSALFGRVKYRHSRQTVNFKQATKAAQQQKGYIHKCAVCGKTDTDYPNEEFRYCSKCNGYYCYCSEHIHNHVHVQ
ncbi:rhomboid family intramembrane serine protease [Lawsonibacter celer]|uniref:rhomboid family intramembrane serine protease n=1 Tax=Lawsonibacter celer TaxID=2986526 RepID=UPI001FAB6A7B|nr:hypothetical protein [Lawsonibacter celer]